MPKKATKRTAKEAEPAKKIVKDGNYYVLLVNGQVKRSYKSMAAAQKDL